MRKPKFNIRNLLIFSFVISFTVCLYLSYDVKDKHKVLVTAALANKTYYHYNVAYNDVIKLPGGKEKTSYLKKLNALKGSVVTAEVIEVEGMLKNISIMKSGKDYDVIMKRIEKINFKQADKEYFFSEAARLGMKYIWSNDYAYAVDAVSQAWTDMTEANINQAEIEISFVKSQINKDYLLEELAKIKKKYKEASTKT